MKYIKKLALLAMLLICVLLFFEDTETTYNVPDLNCQETKYYKVYSEFPEDSAIFLYVDDITDLILDLLPNAKPKILQAEKLPVYLIKHSDYNYDSYGFYDGKAIIVNIDLGVGTIGHEIAHYITDKGNYHLDDFDNEGIAMAFEKTISYYGNNSTEENKLTYGYYHPRRQLNALKYISDKKDFNLENFIESTGRKQVSSLNTVSDYDLVGSLFIYVAQENKLAAYIELLDDKKLDRNKRFNKIFATTPEDFDAKFNDWLTNSASDKDFEIAYVSISCEENAPSLEGKMLTFNPKTKRWTYPPPSGTAASTES